MKPHTDHPGVPASIYMRTELDESGEPRVVSNAAQLPRANDPLARHVVRTLERL